MLLDRRRIRKWAKWVALFLAVVFALSFLFLGVGYGGGAGLNIFDLFGKKDTTNTTLSSDQRIAALQAQLEQNPNDVTTLLALATAYQNNQDYKTAAGYLEQVITVDPSQKDVYIRLANIYLQQLSDYTAAATVLNKAISVDPNNPDVYLKLGIAQQSLGNTEAAILAWQKYLQLDPNGDMASVVRQQIDQLSQQATTTTSTASTATTAAGATSASTSTTTTTASSTTTSAP